MAFYFALLNVSNKRSEDKNRQSQRHSSRNNRQARRHSIASLDEQPLNDYRLLPKPLVVTNELATEHYLKNSAAIKEEMSRARESSLSSRDETPPPKIERNFIKTNLKHNRQSNFKSFKRAQRENQFHDRRESSEIDEPTCSRRFQDNDLYNNREDSASGEDEFRMINSRFRRGFSPLGSPVRTSSAKSSREESRRTSKASSNSSELLASMTGRYGSKTSQNEAIGENKAIASKRVTFDNTNNSVIIEGHFLEERLHWGSVAVPNLDIHLRTVTSAGDLEQHNTKPVMKMAANGVGSSEQYLENLRDTPTRTILQNASNEHAENQNDSTSIQKSSRLLRRRSTSDRSARGTSFCNRGFLLANEELSLRKLEKSFHL